VLRITDKEYFLPIIEALQGFSEFGTGTTKPMLIRGVCRTTHEKSDYVVKYLNSPRMSFESSCRELLASFIARELGLNVAEPALINVTSNFADSLRGKEGFNNAINSIGLNYGSKFFGPGFMELIHKQHLNEEQLVQAKQIFALDIFISNADRRIDKQNMLTNGTKIIIFDHELAFGFIMDIIKNPTPWIIGESDMIWIKNHFFYSTLKGNEHNFITFVEGLYVLDDNFWEKANSLIPNEWKTGQISKIRQNLMDLINNREIFLNEINRLIL